MLTRGFVSVAEDFGSAEESFSTPNVKIATRNEAKRKDFDDKEK